MVEQLHHKRPSGPGPLETTNYVKEDPLEAWLGTDISRGDGAPCLSWQLMTATRKQMIWKECGDDGGGRTPPESW